MTTETHSISTSGPWLDIFVSDGHIYIVRPDDRTLYCATEHDKRMMRAAPEMYEALKSLLWWMDKQARKNECYACTAYADATEHHHDPECSAEIARGVLATATGQWWTNDQAGATALTETALCCFPTCFARGTPAEFEIIGDREGLNMATQACESHLGVLLGTATNDGPKNRSWTVVPIEHKGEKR